MFVLDMQTIGSDFAKDSRPINDNIHCAAWVLERQRLVEFFRHNDAEQERLRRIRQGLLERAVLRAQSFPSPLRLHSESSLKPSHGIDSAIAPKKVSSRAIIRSACIEDL